MVRRLKLSRELTGRIAQRAREERTTIHGALCSALLKSGVSAMPIWRNKQIKLVTPVDLRRRHRIEDDCSLIATGTRAVLPPGFDGPFWVSAREIMRALNVPEAIESAGKATRDMSQLLANGLDVAGALKLRQSALQRDLTVSNLGRLRFEPPAGPFRLTALWGPSVPLGLADEQDSQVIGVATVNGSAHLMLTSLAPAPSLLEIAHELLVRACEL